MTCTVVLGTPGVASTQAGGGKPDAAQAQALQDFQKRVEGYVAIQRQLEQEAPRLPKEASPQQIDAYQRALEASVRQARATARQGDVFTVEVQTLIRRNVVSLLSQPRGRLLKANILDENPVGTAVTVNGRYPDTVPLSTMPPQLLQVLPTLPEGLEYRYVGDALVMLDTRAHVIVDFVPRALGE
jgi:hypothetical protein